MPSKKLSSKANAYLGVVTLLVILTVIGILSEGFFHRRLDLTRNQQFTLSRAAVKTLENLPDLVTVKAVMSKDLPTQFQQIRTHVTDLLNEFEAQSGGRLNLVFDDPGENEQKRQQATSLGIQEVQLQEQSSEGMQIKKGFFGLALLYGDKKEVIPVLQNLETFEYDLIVKLKRLTGSIKTIGLVEGSGPNRFTFALPGGQPGQPGKTTTGFDENFPTLKENIEKVYLIKKLDPIGAAITDDVDLILVSAPSRLSELEKFRIDQHIMKGKSAIFMTPGVDVNLGMGINGTATNNGYEDLLAHYGLGVKKNVMVEPRNFQLVRFGNSFFPSPYPHWITVNYKSLDEKSAITSKLESISMPWTSSVDIDTSVKDSGETQILARTTSESWEESGTFNFMPREMREYLPINAKSQPLIVLKTARFKSFFANRTLPAVDTAGAPDSNSVLKAGRDKARILVIPNALFASDFYVGYTNASGNIHLVLNALDQLALDPDLINVRSRELDNYPIEEAKKTSARLPVILVNLVAAPALLLILGILIGVRRRKKEMSA